MSVSDFDYLTVAQAAREAQASDARIRQVALASGFPGAVKAGGWLWLIPRDDFERWNKNPRRRKRKGAKDGGQKQD